MLHWVLSPAPSCGTGSPPLTPAAALGHSPLSPGGDTMARGISTPSPAPGTGPNPFPAQLSPGPGTQPLQHTLTQPSSGSCHCHRSGQGSSLGKGSAARGHHQESPAIVGFASSTTGFGKSSPQGALPWWGVWQQHCHLPPCHLLCSKGVVVPSFSSSSSLEDAVPLDDSRWSLWPNSPVQGKPTDQ